MKRPNEKWINILRAIRTIRELTGRSPSEREIQEMINADSKLYYALTQLQHRYGYITREPNKVRTIQLTDKGRAFLKAQNNE